MQCHQIPLIYQLQAVLWYRLLTDSLFRSSTHWSSANVARTRTPATG